ncbi:MAG: hypothetical protein EZS28_017677 [Streblomastix strix]|uniref:Uncharacterized protein n=1 Tax=Streblomastix strix TaxID=222440 RepID=A0A5J4VVZ7_9EUKA|nr:MAG: hypothetical protein EZS28_017677 [Streblomastix strix]
MGCQSDREIEFPKYIVQKRRYLSEKVEQIERFGINESRLEQQNVDQKVNSRRDPLMEENSPQQLLNSLDISRTRSSLDYGRFRNTVGRNITTDKNGTNSQRELAAILLGIQSIGKNFEVGEIKSLKIQSDNSTAIFDLRRGAAAPALCKLVDQILQTPENMKIQFSSFHIPGKDNKEADSLSRLSTSGNYGIRKEVLDEALQELAMQPTIDYLANRRNRKCRRFYSLIWDPWAHVQGGMKAKQKRKSPLLHPPMPLIQRVLNKVRKDQIKVIMIIQHWQIQSWWRDLQELKIKSINLGKSSDVLEVVGRMRKQKTAPPSRRRADSAYQRYRGEKLFKQIAAQRGLTDEITNDSIESWHGAWRRHRQRLGQFLNYWEGISRKWEDLKIKSACAVTLLLKVAGHNEHKINGKMLEQIMKKHSAAIKKVHKEEPIYHLDDLLKILDQRAQTIDQLTEDILLGCTIETIIAFSKLRLKEVMRATAEKIQTIPVLWLDNWTKKNSNRPKPTMLWSLTKTNRVASTQQPSRAAHAIMNLAGINKSRTITSIRSSSITKAIDQGATPYQINRFSRHKDGPTQFSSSMIRISIMTQERDLRNFERQSQQKVSSRYVNAKIITRYDVVIYAFHQSRANL